MVKKTMGPQRGKKTRKENKFYTVPYLLHWWIRAMGPQRIQKNKRGQKNNSSIAQTFLWGGWNIFNPLQKSFFHNAQQIPLGNKIKSIFLNHKKRTQ
jgi:hypothetical protein